MIITAEYGTLDNAPEHGAYMPWITPLPNGCFIANQHVGSGLGANYCRIEILRFPDGRQWHNEGQIVNQCSNYSYRMPQIHALPGGCLLMTATRFACNYIQLFDPESEALQQSQMLLYFSEDLGRRWSKPQIIPVELPTDRYTANGAGMLIQLRHGR